ncbi:MAG: extracellular solute-binding protein, partial [Calditrichia bacterium]|nr:extracellular solute-binding protein [Calditrichia bacterium]
SNMWPGDVELYVRANALVRLDSFADFDSVATERFSDDYLEQSHSKNGFVYQVLWKTNPIMMLYNKKLFAQAGIFKPPATYSEYLEAAEKLTKDTDGDGYDDRWIGITQILVTWWQRFFDFYPLYLAASGGAKLIDNNKVVFNNKYAVETFAFLQKLYNQNYFARELLSARQDVFLSGVIATRFTGPWDIVHTEKFKPNGFEYSFAPLPAPDSSGHQRYTYGDPKNIVIFNTCKHPENAWKFLSFLINRKNDLLLLTTTTQLPRRKKLFEDKEFNDYFNNNPKIIPFAEQAQYVRGTDPCPVLKEIFDIISMEYEACVVYGIKTPEQAVKDAAKTAQLLLD